ncbi:MAG: thiamine diphosphokinase [Spirochaetes bacterium]|nr:thiamine diphosphokinase [Spirochaetota bacterium]
MYKHIVIVCNGDDYNEKKLLDYCNKSDYIIAADGGLNILDRLAIIPDFIIGDMDSAEPNLLLKYERIPKKVLQTEKDLTDSEFAIQKAIALNPNKISIFAATGSFVDHSIANIINLLRNNNKKIEMKIITQNSEIFSITDEKIILNSIGIRFSLFPIGIVKGISMKGCKYLFKRSNISPIDYSVSNVITENEARIKIKKGMLICILFDVGL